VPGFIRYETKRFHMQAAALLRQIRYDGGPGEANLTEFGWGFNGTFKAKTAGEDEIMGQFAYGEGVAHYIEALSGTNSDAVFNASGDLKLLPARAGVLGYTHHWNKALRSGLAYGTAIVSTNAIQPGSTLKQTQDARGNVIWSPYHLIDVGSEILWGRRDDRNGTHGEAWRFQFALTYRLN
jgi:hypothetical protein